MTINKKDIKVLRTPKGFKVYKGDRTYWIISFQWIDPITNEQYSCDPFEDLGNVKRALTQGIIHFVKGIERLTNQTVELV